MDVENWLNQVRILDQQIEDNLEEKNRLFALATDISPKPMDGMPFSNTGTVSQKIPNAVMDLIAVTQEIDKLVAKYIEKRKQIITVLERLPEKEYQVLYKYYIHKSKGKRITWEQVAEDLGLCTVQVWRIKKNAYRMLQDMICKVG